MPLKEVSYKSQIAFSIAKEVGSINFGDGFGLYPVVDSTAYSLVKKTLGMDVRVRDMAGGEFASVFDGLAFDGDKVRTQAFSVFKEGVPVGLITMAIVPSFYIDQQRYLLKEEDGIRICDFKTINHGEKPDFLVVPAFTKVDPEYLLKFAIPGFRAICKILQIIKKSAPQNTWIEIIAQGQLYGVERDRLNQLVKLRGLGSLIGQEDLQFPLSQIGKNNEGSSSSVKLARLLGMRKVPNVGYCSNLGPVFSANIVNISIPL